MMNVPAGTFAMGSDRHNPEEAPVHRVGVDSLLVSRTTVTNEQFSAFVGSSRAGRSSVPPSTAGDTALLLGGRR
jgi:formylglycine-generating enzyme required for sulfatase activity